MSVLQKTDISAYININENELNFCPSKINCMLLESLQLNNQELYDIFKRIILRIF